MVGIDKLQEYLSGFSAILMDNDYYNYAITHASEIKGVQVLDKDALVVLKSKAYLNNRKRKEEGQNVQQDDINKHKKDIYRLSFLFSGEERYEVSDGIKEDLKDFLAELSTDTVSTKAIAKAMGVAEVSIQDFIKKIENIFQLNI
jgi:hypothetical protein